MNVNAKEHDILVCVRVCVCVCVCEYEIESEVMCAMLDVLKKSYTTFELYFIVSLEVA
jgi:hypothetical protein